MLNRAERSPYIRVYNLEMTHLFQEPGKVLAFWGQVLMTNLIKTSFLPSGEKEEGKRYKSNFEGTSSTMMELHQQIPQGTGRTAVGTDTLVQDRSHGFIMQRDLMLLELLLHLTARYMGSYLPGTRAGWLQFPQDQ